MPFSSIKEVQEGLLNPAIFPVRPSLALIARGLRRVLPLADLQNLEVGLTVGVMESVAAGEPFDMHMVNDAVASWRRPRADGAPWSPQAAEFALETASSLERNLDRPQTAAKPPDLARLSKMAAEVLFVSFKMAASAGDDETPVKALLRDAEKVAGSITPKHRRAYGWIGPAIEAGSYGPLGVLWPGSTVPEWFNSAVARHGASIPDVMRLDKFADNPDHYTDLVDAVCWHVDRTTSSGELQEVLNAIKTGVSVAAKAHLPPPTFVIHAPDLDDPRWLEGALEAGATLLRTRQVCGVETYDSDTLVRAVHCTLLEGQLGWQSDGAVDYVSMDPRVCWRLSSEQRASMLSGPPQSESVSREPVSGPGIGTLVIDEASRVDFESIISGSRSASERLRSEAGWPSDEPNG